jgi:hypothetical protein
VAVGQSLSIVQTTQRCSCEHTGVDVPAQLALLTHCTHVDEARSQWGAGAAHCESLMQPARQVKLPGLQMGAAVPQSALERHATQRPSPTRHRGAPAGQSPLVAHWTHCWVVASQILAPAGQSAAVLHPTHAPVLVLQMGAFRAPGVQFALLAQAARQVCVAG